MKDLIIIKQLPIIEERLKNLSAEIDEKIKKAKAMVCSEETVKTVKVIRAELRKDFTELEEQRKQVKEKVLAPYNQFEEVYKRYVSDKFTAADTELKNNISEVEKALKEQKEAEVRAYFEEYLQSKNIDFVTYENASINVTLSASMKSLKEQSKAFIDRIASDLALIDTQNNKTEIMVEYKKHLNVSLAITTVTERYIAIEKEQEKAVESEQIKEVEEKVIEKVEAVAAPVLEQERKRMRFPNGISHTIEKLKELKSFLIEGGYEYE